MWPTTCPSALVGSKRVTSAHETENRAQGIEPMASLTNRPKLAAYVAQTRVDKYV